MVEIQEKSMEQLLKSVGLMQNDVLLPGFIFGVVHVSLVILGFYTGWSINRLLKNVTKGYIAGIIGASLAHVIADLVAAIIDPTMRARTAGIVLGGLLIIMASIYIAYRENKIDNSIKTR